MMCFGDACCLTRKGSAGLQRKQVAHRPLVPISCRLALHTHAACLCYESELIFCMLVQVLAARWYESFFGRKAAKHLCVSKAMQQFLQSEWGIAATVFYDTAPDWFHRANVQERHELFTRIAADLNAPMHTTDLSYASQSPYSRHEFPAAQDNLNHVPSNGLLESDHNVFTSVVHSKPQLKSDRPALIVSSTSWTVDEDFAILLQAALQYEKVSTSLSPACSLCPPFLFNSPAFARRLIGKQDYFIELTTP